MALGQLHIHNAIRIIILEDELLHLNQSNFFGQSTFKITVKSFNFVGMNFSGLKMMDMFMENCICGFSNYTNYTQEYQIKSIFRWNFKFVDGPTQKKEMKCPTNKTVLERLLHSYTGQFKLSMRLSSPFAQSSIMLYCQSIKKLACYI